MAYTIFVNVRPSIFAKASIDIGFDNPLTVSGSTANQSATKKQWKTDDDHIVNIGELVEGNAGRFREVINNIYISKMKEILSNMAEQDSHSVQKSMIDQLNAAFLKRKV